ncbi:related to nucleotide diphosphatase [Ustilago trichophora]|uniref:Related to nucleotide diphosphatase n=1 Tax=Ustilago trichophora TaxID=86804 RepID=A0A5C3E4L1_9BASI|nr:related to nucleotide diphosphatase [Ustilago trichophora]
MAGIDERGEGSRSVGQDQPAWGFSPGTSRSGRVLGKNVAEEEQADNVDPPSRVEEPDSRTPLLRHSPSARQSEHRYRRTCFIYRLLLPLFLIIALLAIFHNLLGWSSTPTSDLPSSLLPNSTISNGTHTFRRTVLLISLDGAKPSYLTPALAPQLHNLGTSRPNSRKAAFMQAIFPTLTFPNHWALLTGLFASSHGIVANDFTLASTGQQFYYTSPENSWNGSWWMGEPIWATAERVGLNSAVLMWPGPPVTSAGFQARYFQKYESGPEWNLDGRLRQVLKWIDMERVEERPSLICAYVPDIDQAAHKFGPESRQALSALERVDAFIGELRRELVEKRNLSQVVDIVVVSDHGMTKTSNDKLVFLDDLLGQKLYASIVHRDGWPSAGLRFKGTPSEQQAYASQAYDKLSRAQEHNGEGWSLYWREDLPERYHLASPTVQDRLAPLWMIPELGWSITTHPEMATFADGVYAPVGNHGYDNKEADMHAIFVASGPSFTKTDKGGKNKGWNMDGFANVEVHNLVSRILGIPERKRPPTNGTWTFWDAHLRAGL